MKYLISITLLLFLASCGHTEKTAETGSGELAVEKELPYCKEETEEEKKLRKEEEAKKSFFAKMFKKEETEECREPKQDFFVEAQKLEDFPADYRIKKVGKLSSSQSVKLSSNAVGRITSIKVKEGQSVKSGQLLATLADNIGSYNLNVERASNAISRAKINYDSQKIALDKQVADSNLLLARLGKNLVNLEKTNAQNITRNMNDSENINSEASLEKIELSVAKIEQNMEKIAQNIEKLELDAENVKMSNRETINGFRSTILSEQNSLRLSLDDIIEFADEILGVTPENEDENDRIDSYLGARDRIQRNESEHSLRDLIVFRNGDFEAITPSDLGDMTEEDILGALSTGQVGYNMVEDLLANLELTFQNSISSVGRLSDTDIDAYIAQINGYQASTQGSYAGFIALSNQIESFLSTYKNSELSTQKQIELLAKDKEILKNDRDILLNDYRIQKQNLETTEKNLSLGLESTITQGEDAIINLQNQIDQAQLNYNNAKKNRTVSLKSLNNQIAETQIAYKEAVRERAKLSIFAPISGTVASVNVDLGQEVSNGAEIFNIQNSSKSEIVIGLTDDELDNVKIGKKVAVKFGDSVGKGEIFSISEIADENLNYKTSVKLTNKIEKLGEIVEVHIPIASSYALIPLNAIEVDNTGEIGVLSVYDAEKNSLKSLRVKLGQAYDDSVEIRSCERDGEDARFIPCASFKKELIVTNNVNNFDENKFTIVRKED